MFKGKQYSSMQVLYNLSNKLFELAKGFAAHCVYKTSIQQDLLLLNYCLFEINVEHCSNPYCHPYPKVESMEMGVEYFYAHWIYEKGKEMQVQHQHLFKRKKILTDIENWHSIDPSR